MMTDAPAYSYAFQPIVDIGLGQVVSYEALVRGQCGEAAFHVLQAVAPADRHLFDQQSRSRAIGIAAALGIDCDLNLNCLPQSLVASPTALASTVMAARKAGIALTRLVLEVTETELISDVGGFAKRLDQYRGQGLRVAIDDFGAGFSGLNLLADFQPEQIKIDMHLVRGIERHGPRQAIVRALIQACADLGIDVVAEGVETEAEFDWFARQGVDLFQGYLFARPGFECLPSAALPTAA
ncbi:MAG: EAL domain-containing protein [Burkholderiaceae bacterium]